MIKLLFWHLIKGIRKITRTEEKNQLMVSFDLDQSIGPLIKFTTLVIPLADEKKSFSIIELFMDGKKKMLHEEIEDADRSKSITLTFPLEIRCEHIYLYRIIKGRLVGRTIIIKQ